MLPEETLEQAALLLRILQSRGLTLATAESCTGGLVAAAVTAVPGSSATLLGGYVTYSNEAKSKSVGVDPALIARLGAVSAEVAAAMAEGAARESGASMGISTTGIAGPGGGTASKPVGLVYVGVALAGQPARVEGHVFPGDRTAVRAATVATAFRMAAEEAASVTSAGKSV
ncbi:CinA family protein [Roseomonas marmotae]|uniref:Nicotinamide-nucleotide amidohydrolase family protein n=1 Tax=Roseomonas marmotae TaxID=2768161 RepID=A0ABS3KA25_9PROT|nr:nicotinamide-nucleotide amidohydrolase family protein [Roseomonas marmotae]MBO1074306.1 nicotinamide-nucleotide amidohydrolase family protein [Roseomonas marmotae]QTI80914.1 nicotinamide-nucleotide amidohydrolase family protein [Roseomonas marmotae]